MGEEAFAILFLASLVLPVIVLMTIDHPTGYPYETRPEPDGYLTYRIIPIPDIVKIERDVMVTMPDGERLAANVYRPDKPGRFPVILGMTHYGKDQTPPAYNPDGSFAPTTYNNYTARLYTGGIGMGHQRISMLTAFEFADPAFWVPNDYVVIIADARGVFLTASPEQGGKDLCRLIEWAAAQPWSNGSVGMLGVSALAFNQYYVAGLEQPPPQLRAICPWEGFSDQYRDASFWGGVPETNFLNRPVKTQIQALPAEEKPEEAARIWAAGIDPVANQGMLETNPKLERIRVPALICATWTDKGCHTRGTFEVFRRIASTEKWLYTHGGNKWDRFYGEDGLASQKQFFDHYLKGEQNGWQDRKRVRLEVRETRDEYTVRWENEFPLARTRYRRLYLNAEDGSLSTRVEKNGKVTYQSTQGGSASFGITFDEETELTGYMKLKLWVQAPDADDMDLFVSVRKFAGPCDADTPICKALEKVIGRDRIARGNEIAFWGHDGLWQDVAARGQMRVSQRELDPALSTDYQPVQRFQGEKKLKPGEIVPVEIALLPSSTLFRKGQSLRLFVQGYSPTDHWVVYNDWLINRGRHVLYTGPDYDSYLQIPVIPS